ncbi:hypothetical protein IQ247_23995 [Plectonema cf. radiosum LEGE 06105]|uniref:Uncharacterized protein n=1 Tax=Plectonema cf. radiosum LEGE 06105 TaxID=945769 RepID=A0A8J7F7Q3_9CYAN|nr:hypothetical protein [Plectonema radiosum]MBE9215690.1 hypothetical protein [Plectonema cf. radiosum LEGE 06105]
MKTKLVFKTQYRLDLKPVESIIIPYLFDKNDSSLIISLQANPSRNYRSSGTINQILIDYPNKLTASSQIIRFGTQLFEFPKKGRFQLKFYPNYYLGKTNISIQKIMNTQSYLRALIPSSKKITLPASTPVKILDVNSQRVQLIFRTINDPVILATEFDQNNDPVILLDEIKSNQRHVLEESISGMYFGEYWAYSIRQTVIGITEFSTQ